MFIYFDLSLGGKVVEFKFIWSSLRHDNGVFLFVWLATLRRQIATNAMQARNVRTLFRVSDVRRSYSTIFIYFWEKIESSGTRCLLLVLYQ